MGCTVETLEKLPEDKVHEVADYADFVLKNMKRRFFKKVLKPVPPNQKALSFSKMKRSCMVRMI